MEEGNIRLQEACSALEEIIAENDLHLNELQEEISQTVNPRPAATRKQMRTADKVAALEARKCDLAFLLGEARPTDCHQKEILSNKSLILSLARASQSRSKTEMQQLLVEEKLRQASIKKECERKTKILNELTMILNAFLKKMKSIEELELAELKALKAKTNDLENTCSEMRMAMAELFDKYFGAPQIPGYTSMYELLQHLMKPLRQSRRSTYIRVKDSVWPYYLEILETNGIIEYHRVDKSKIRLVDFSNGQLGFDPEKMEAVRERVEAKMKAKKVLKKNISKGKKASEGNTGRERLVVTVSEQKSDKALKKSEESVLEEEEWEDDL
ncbi:centromere protein K [Daphnia magna]|uniref:Putative Centromere protein K n=1 Tax=Daphnia magna TaxID=35525 RepID=A0A0P4WQ56_9CRUS|nr:centromere protein K [Daphnia magna]KZS20517.1 putative Centromere protein K [Daphnia magna]